MGSSTLKVSPSGHVNTIGQWHRYCWQTLQNGGSFEARVWMDTRRKPNSLVVPVVVARRESALFSLSQQECAVDACLPDTIVAHVCCVANRRIGHAKDRWGMYLYSLIMIVAFSKEALLE